MTLHKAAEIVSLSLTIPTIVLGLATLYVWKSAAVESIKSKNKGHIDWLIIGVCAGFAGSVVDNLYWGIPWSLDFFGHGAAAEWFKNGVYANVFFRQTAGAFAGYCHLRSATLAEEHKAQLALRVSAASCWLGVAASIVMICWMLWMR